MNELSLFTGAGGGLLGTKLLGFKHIGYVEIDEYCQKVISQRIKDGILDNAPIFTDIRAFLDSGCAELYRGVADVITAGFPCQPFSGAGKKIRQTKDSGESDKRNMWPSTLSCLRIIQPRYALLENVPGLLADRYIQRIFGDLAESRYDARWVCLSFARLGGHHIRERLWILAYPTSERWRFQEYKAFNGIDRTQWCDSQKDTEIAAQGFGTKTIRLSVRDRWADINARTHRNNDGMASDVDRIRAIGNGQVPIVVKTVWELLNGN